MKKRFLIKLRINLAESMDPKDNINKDSAKAKYD